MRTFWLFVGPIVTGIWYYLLFVAAWVLWYLKFKKITILRKNKSKNYQPYLTAMKKNHLMIWEYLRILKLR